MTSRIILFLIAVNMILLLVLLIAAVLALRRSRSHSDERRLDSSSLEAYISREIGSLRSFNDSFRKEVSSYLEKSMASSFDAVERIYKENISQTKSTAEALDKIRESLSDSLLSLKLSTKTDFESFKKDMQAEFEKIISGNEKKLEEMRKTVDEKLQSTLEVRLAESFKLVSSNLEQLRSALSEITKLSKDVSDLNKVFGNVKSRGVWGEVQLEAILSDILSPEQYVRNFHPRAKSAEAVEFAVRLPGKGDGEVFIPIDSKFPKEDYERYADASSSGEDAKAFLKALRDRVRREAQEIAEKYINPPRTTDFAILFVPTESLYAELLRDPGYADGIQRRYKVIISGPTTFSALLVSLSMGFRSLQIEKKTKEVRDLFARIKVLMARFSEELIQTQNAIGNAGRKIDNVIKRNNMITQRLEKIELGEESMVPDSIDIPLCDDSSPFNE